MSGTGALGRQRRRCRPQATIRFGLVSGAALIAGSVVCAIPVRLSAQAVAVDTVSVVPNDGFAAGSLMRSLWGDQYRDSWGTEIDVPVLDLRSFAGGLVTTRSDISETAVPERALYLQGSNGVRYVFRSLERGIETFVPDFMLKTIAHDILVVLIASQQAVAPLVANSLEDAAGVLNLPAELYVLPDDPALGEFRPEFGGMVGLLVEEDEGQESAAPWALAGAAEILTSPELDTRRGSAPSPRVDARAFLKVRLLDLLMGDWFQERRQWIWARAPGDSLYVPVPVNRYQAFTKLDGFFPSLAWHVVPSLVSFRDEYPRVIGLHLSAWEMDRWILPELSRSTWDSLTADLTSRLTDEVIENAVRRLPPAMFQVDGPELIRKLKQRRDLLPEAASEFYELLAREVDVHGSDLADQARILGVGDTAVVVELALRPNGSSTHEPYLRRTFYSSETRDLRIYLHGGSDYVHVEGPARLGMQVRVVTESVDDEVHLSTPTSGVRVYNQHGETRLTGNVSAASKVVADPWEEWVYAEDDQQPPRDWGTRTDPAATIGISGDYGLFIGVGFNRYGYAFRKDPYAYKLRLVGGISTQGKIDIQFDGDWRKEASSQHAMLGAFISQLKVLHFFGFGNDSQVFADTEFYDVEATVFGVQPALGLSVGPNGRFSIGVDLQYRVDGDNSGRFVGQVPDLYGTGDFASAGAFLAYELDSRDYEANASRGATALARVSVYPPIGGVEEYYGSLDLEGSSYLTPGFFDRATLALRAGSRLLLGPSFPFFQSAFIGGTESLRGWHSERFAGDASLYGNAELRVAVLRIRKLLPGDLGVFGMADAARVWFDGESPGGFHWGLGGGLSFAFVGRAATVSGSFAAGSQGGILYFDLGYRF